jgi:hypothetical protein
MHLALYCAQNQPFIRTFTSTGTDFGVKSRHAASAVTIFAISELDLQPCGDHAKKDSAPTSMFRLAARPDTHSSRSSQNHDLAPTRRCSLLRTCIIEIPLVATDAFADAGYIEAVTVVLQHWRGG